MIAGMTSLEVLHISLNRRITDAGLAFLIETPLQQLSLHFCKYLSNDGLCSFLAGKPLTCLDLRMVGVTRHGRKVTDRVLPTLMGLPLVKLVLDDRLLSDASLEALLEAVPSIEEVHVYEYDDDWDHRHEDRLARILHGQASRQ